MSAESVNPGWSAELLTFAMDHRDSFRTLLGLADPPRPGDTATGRAIKSAVFDGFASSVDALGPTGLAVLLDDEYGAPLAARAHGLGVKVIAPVERSGRAELELEYDDALPRLVDTLQADLVKVLLRHNVAGDAALNARQAETLARLSTWCLNNGVPLMAEVLVPQTAAQRELFGGTSGQWDRVVLPDLTCQAITQLRAAGADPAMWKIEGVDDPAHAEAVVAAARAGGREDVSCVVLGRGESLIRVEEWLRLAAGVVGFVGFAVGRSLWNDEAKAFHNGEVAHGEAVSAIATKYTHLVNAWRSARAARGSTDLGVMQNQNS